jgi:hypothetical protein
MTGLNIQAPWSSLLINGLKTVETRSYRLPLKYEGVELYLVETPGKLGKFKARVIGTITFSHSFKYSNQKAWQDDHNRHCVEINDPVYSWKENKPKYGWIVSKVKKFKNPVDITKRKGIIFTTGLKLKKEQFNESECY